MLKEKNEEVQSKYQATSLDYDTLKVEHDKLKELFEQQKLDLEDTVGKLHVTNKVRHETEIKLDQSKARNVEKQEEINRLEAVRE